MLKTGIFSGAKKAALTHPEFMDGSRPSFTVSW